MCGLGCKTTMIQGAMTAECESGRVTGELLDTEQSISGASRSKHDVLLEDVG